MGLGISVLSSKALSVVVENLFRKMNLTDAYSTESATKFAEETRITETQSDKHTSTKNGKLSQVVEWGLWF